MPIASNRKFLKELEAIAKKIVTSVAFPVVALFLIVVSVLAGIIALVATKENTDTSSDPTPFVSSNNNDDLTTFNKAFISKTDPLTGENNPQISAKVADTNEERANGLMNRTSLPENSGMLFIFKKPQVVEFWMKDTPTSLDIIFIDENKQIVNIARNTIPENESIIYSSRSPVIYVLEVGSNFTVKNNYSVGDKLEINFE